MNKIFLGSPPKNIIDAIKRRQPAYEDGSWFMKGEGIMCTLTPSEYQSSDADKEFVGINPNEDNACFFIVYFKNSDTWRLYVIVSGKMSKWIDLQGLGEQPTRLEFGDGYTFVHDSTDYGLYLQNESVLPATGKMTYAVDGIEATYMRPVFFKKSSSSYSGTSCLKSSDGRTLWIDGDSTGNTVVLNGFGNATDWELANNVTFWFRLNSKKAQVKAGGKTTGQTILYFYYE